MRDLQELRQQWQQTFGFTPPPLMSPEFIQGNLAYNQQCKQQGGLNPKTHKHLLAMGQDSIHHPNTRSYSQIRSGTKLIRMWQGEPHEVSIITPRQFTYRDQTFPSLSAIANHITGTKWNGHAFFGLKKAVANAR
jgi:hypothetical protein